jgi:hypothetical protein
MYPFSFDPWAWRDPSFLAGVRDREATNRTDEEVTDRGAGGDLVGYSVEATDGRIGSIDEASTETGSSYLIVDTGPWIFGRKVLLPAGTVQRVDHDEQKVYVDRTKDRIKDSPEYDPDTFGKPEYRARVGSYYEGSYRSIPPPM